MIYSFKYPGKNITQTKILISHADYLAWDSMPDSTDEEKVAKDLYLRAITGGNEWFTDKSPYFEAIKTGVLHCNGSFLCIVTPIFQDNS